MGRTASLFLVAVVILGSAGTANAQYIGPINRFGTYPYGYLGYYPGAYSSSWSNGYTLYGPPVPTYGITPGAFGGSDNRLNNNINIQNGAGIGLGRSGAGGAGPRSRHYAGRGNYGGLTAPNSNNNSTGQAAIEVKVPTENAEVFFESVNTQQKGTTRNFASPQIPVGVTHFYKIRARWTIDGEAKEETKSVGIRANERILVDFTKPETANNLPVLGQP